MKYIYLVLFLAIFACNGQEKNDDSKKSSKISQNIKENNNQNRREQELNYIKRRNSNIEYFKNKEINDKVDNQMNDSILALEKLLKNILINTRIKNINKTGQINLRTFFPELGFGMLDALGTYKEEITTLCTTNFIFTNYFQKTRI